MKLKNIIILLSFPFLVNGQGGFKAKHYIPNALTNEARAIFETTPNNYIAAGIIVDTVFTTYVNRLVMMGINTMGQLMWFKKYGNTKFEYLSNSFITRSFYKKNNHIYHACSARDSNNKYIGVLLKFDFNGDTIWQKIYRDVDPLEDVIPQMVSSSVDGGFLITGFFQNSSTSPYSKCMLIKTDANGNELWRKKIGKITPNVQDGKAIVQDSASKKIVITGYQYMGMASAPSTNDNVLILDSIGNKLGQYNYAGFGGNSVDLIQTRDKKFVVVGRSIYPQTVGGDNLVRSFAAKFDINAPTTPIWKIDNFDKLVLNNFFHCLRELDNEDLMVGGFIDTMQFNNLPRNALTRLTRIDKNGNVKSSRYYDYKTNEVSADNNHSILSLELTSDGGWVVAIQQSNTPSPNPFFFVKYDSTGCDSSAAHCATLNLVGANEWKTDDTKLKIYPNPVLDFLSIETSYTEEMELCFTDVLGREVKRLRLRQNNKIDVRDLETGMYLITISRNSEIINKTKIIKED